MGGTYEFGWTDVDGWGRKPRSRFWHGLGHSRSEGRDIIHLEIGEPDFDTPGNVVEAGRRALEQGETHYTPSAGIRRPLREAIAVDQARRKGIDVSPLKMSSSRPVGSP